MPTAVLQATAIYIFSEILLPYTSLDVFDGFLGNKRVQTELHRCLSEEYLRSGLVSTCSPDVDGCPSIGSLSSRPSVKCFTMRQQLSTSTCPNKGDGIDKLSFERFRLF